MGICVLGLHFALFAVVVPFAVVAFHFLFHLVARRETSFAFILRVMLAVLLLLSLSPCFTIRSIS